MAFDKFKHRSDLYGYKSLYARLDWRNARHHERFDRRVKQTKITCQDCGGSGGEIEVVTDYGEGPWVDCGWCEGTGYVTPWLRGAWMRMKKQEKKRVVA